MPEQPGPSTTGTDTRPASNGTDPYARDTENAREAHLESELETAEIGGQVMGVTEPAEPSRRRKRGSGILFWLALGWVMLVVFCALFASFLPFQDPNFQSISDRLEPPFGEGGILGNDGLGRDVLARLA